MKKVKILSLIAGIMVTAYSAIIFSGCSKGDPGYQGMTGPTGPTGVNGVANIQIKVYTVTFANWAPISGPPMSYSYTVNNTEINDPANEAIIVYYSFGSKLGKYNWQPLPATNVLGPGDQLGFGWNTNHVTFTYDSVGTLFSAPTPTIFFNVAVVPPAIMQRHPNTNWKDGNAVLNLPEMQAAINQFAIKP